MSGAARMKPIVPWWQLVLLLAGCAVGIWFLLPDDPGLLNDLLRDGNTREARKLLAKMSPEQRAKDIRHLRVIELKIDRLELKPNDTAAIDAFWRKAVGAWRDSQFTGEVFIELAPIISRLPNPASAWALIAPDVHSIPETLRARLIADFTRAALSVGQSETAATIYAVGHPSTTRTPEESLELARLWQLAGRASEAFDALGDNPAPLLAARRVELLRELNRNREAFDLLVAQVNALPDRTPDAALAEEIAAVALAAGRAADAVPFLQAYADKNPSDLNVQRRLRGLLVTSGQPAKAIAPAQHAVQLSARNLDDIRELAKILEYAGEAEQAFDLWLELGLQSDLAAVDRLVALNPGLYRDDDLRRALERVVPVPGHDDYTLKLARFEVVVGRYDEARIYFEKYLAAEPAAVEVMLELASLHNELYRFAEAEAWLRRASALRPNDISLRRQIADSLVLQNRSNDALAYYAKLAKESPTEEVLGPYIRLAESLGRYAEFTNGLRLRIENTNPPNPRDFLLLAYGYELADDPVNRERVLKEASERTQHNDDITLQLAFALAAEKNYRAAQEKLTPHRGRHTNSVAATLYLELMRLNNDTAAERRYLAEPLAPNLVENESITERVARAREATGDLKEAERLWRKLYALRPTEFARAGDLARVLLASGNAAEATQILAPFLINPSPAVLRLSAEIASAGGDYQTAEKYQLAYLEKLKTAGPTEWGALGDIRLSRGDREGAKRAYAEALRRMHAQIRAKAAP